MLSIARLPLDVVTAGKYRMGNYLEANGDGLMEMA
jgi:hypothetical protein